MLTVHDLQVIAIIAVDSVMFGWIIVQIKRFDLESNLAHIVAWSFEQVPAQSVRRIEGWKVW